MSHTDMTREQLLARLRELERENAELMLQLGLSLPGPQCEAMAHVGRSVVCEADQALEHDQSGDGSLIDN